METETATPVWGSDRWLAWCATCRDMTESDDTTCRWCLQCGDRRESN